MHYNRFRYYDSDVGVFIQRDPIGLLDGNNVFQYAPNPVGWVDPWGLCTDVLPTVNGRKIINSHLAGKSIQTKGGVANFDEYGFPDFTPYSIKTVRVEGLTGKISDDVPKALKAAGLKANEVDNVKYV